MDAVELAVARLSHPAVDAHPEQVDELPEQFVAENRLRALLAARGIDVGNDPLADQRVRVEELGALLTDVGKAGGRVLLIKYPGLPKCHRDIDLLVASGFDAVDRVLRDRGYEVTSDAEPYKRGYERRIDGTTVDFDVHEAVTWWGNTYLDTDDLWADRTERELYDVTVPVPSPEHEFLVCAANAAFGEVRLNLFDVLTAWWLCERGVDASAARREAEAAGWCRQYDYVAGLIEQVHVQLFDDTLGVGEQNVAPSPISDLPYRYPVSRILSLRARKVATDVSRAGLQEGISSARGYVLESLQLGIDYAFYLADVPKHGAFNMRSFLPDTK